MSGFRAWRNMDISNLRFSFQTADAPDVFKIWIDPTVFYRFITREHLEQLRESIDAVLNGELARHFSPQLFVYTVDAHMWNERRKAIKEEHHDPNR